MSKHKPGRKDSGTYPLLLIEPLEARQLLSSSATEIVSPSLIINADAKSSASTIAGYTPAEIETAYGISSIKFDGVTGNGAGQTIAIVDAYSDPNISSDLAVFDKEFDLAAPPSFTQESAKGSTTKLPAENADWDEEISLDVEWAHAIAPDAKIVLVDASSDSMSSLMAAVEYARTITSVSVISMSWGGSEFSGETAYDQYFTTPAGHINITFVAASGDDGAAGGADYPAASPNVVSVGGTTLSLNSTGTIESETAWSDSEGGVSSYESTPSYQSGVSSSGRSTPDVSYDADPDTGFAVYDSVSDDGYVGWQEVGGTSAGTPQWSALIAIADQGRAKNGLGTLSSTQTLDELYGIYANSTDYAADFNDITSGSSVLSEGGGFGGGFGGPFGGGPFGGRFGGRGQTVEVSATTGYDTLTGLGTPKAASLVETLAVVKLSSSATTSAVATNAKVSKTTKATDFSPAIEYERVASVFNVQVAQGSSLFPLQRDQSNIEVDITAGSTAAATGSVPKQGEATPSGASHPEFLVDGGQSTAVAAAGPNGPAVESLIARASESASHLVTGVALDAARLGADATVAMEDGLKLPNLFSDVTVAQGFRRALDEFTRAAPVLAVPQRRSSASSTLLNVATAAAEAVWIGYWYAKRKKTADGETVFSDEPMT